MGRPDPLGRRRLGRGEAWTWYTLAFATYVGLSVWHKWLLNWFVGPMWLVGVVWFGPVLTDRFVHRRPEHDPGAT